MTHTTRIVILIVLAFALVGLGAGWYFSQHRPQTVTTSTISASSTPNGVFLGARVDPDGKASIQDPASSEADVLQLESQIGRRLAIDNEYVNWADFSTQNPPQQAAWDIANGRIPMISWKTDYPGHPPGCATAADIVNGVYDVQLKDQAQAIKSLGSLVLLRWHYEMEHPEGGTCFYSVDVTKDPVDAGTEYVAAWKRVVDIFRAEDVTNAEWVWAPGDDAFSDNKNTDGPSSMWKDFYPGNNYVDWIGADIYNKQPTTVSIADSSRFTNFYNQVASLGKPLMLSETGAVGPDPQPAQGYDCAYSIGSSTDPGTEWMQSAESTFKMQFPAMKAFVYWDNIGTGGPYHCNNYILRGASLDAFKAMGADPYFNPTL